MLRKRIALSFALILLAALAWLGITGGVREIPQSSSPGQQVQALSQLAYGLLSLAVVITAFWFHAWATPIRLSFLTVITIAGGLAPVVWGGEGVIIGLLGGVSALLVTWGIVWLLRFGTGEFPVVIDDARQP